MSTFEKQLKLIKSHHLNCVLWAKKLRSIGCIQGAAQNLNAAAVWRREIIWMKANRGLFA